MKLNVISLFRDAEPHLERTFRNLDALERRHHVSCFFYENDSMDGTARRLREWAAGRSCLVVTETRNARKFGHTMEPDRVIAMASYRNRILAEAQRVESDWTLLFDSDVDFPEDIIERYLAYDDPDVAMYTPFVEMNRPCQMCEPTCGRFAYYDTYALRDRQGRRGLLMSCNPFWDIEDRRRWASGEPVEVQSAFGGAALIRSDVLQRCHWHSDGDCEHVGLARQVRATSKILAMPTVRVSTTVDHVAVKPETIVMQRQLLSNPLLLQFWTSRYDAALASMIAAGGPDAAPQP